ncbi:hypothetical protein MASR2M66_25980 [Chloroflexota bacterium]
MEQITIQVKNKKKAQALIDFLKSLDFIEDINFTNLSGKSATGLDEKDFFALAGIWAERDVTLELIRSKAWPARS